MLSDTEPITVTAQAVKDIVTKRTEEEALAIDAEEPLLKANPRRFVLFPLQVCHWRVFPLCLVLYLPILFFVPFSLQSPSRVLAAPLWCMYGQSYLGGATDRAPEVLRELRCVVCCQQQRQEKKTFFSS